MAKEWNADDQVFFLNILTTAEQWNFFVIVGWHTDFVVGGLRESSTYHGSIISANTSRLQGLTPGIPSWSGKVNVFDNANANCD